MYYTLTYLLRTVKQMSYVSVLDGRHSFYIKSYIRYRF